MAGQEQGQQQWPAIPPPPAAVRPAPPTSPPTPAPLSSPTSAPPAPPMLPPGSPPPVAASVWAPPPASPYPQPLSQPYAQQYGQAWGAAPGYWTPPPAQKSRPGWLQWVAAGVALLIVAVPLFRGTARSDSPSNASGLHAVTSISSAPWTAEFLDNSGLPARWDPCTPVHYVVNATEGPIGGLADVQEAFARLATATGMTFVYDGPTDEVGSQGREAYQPDRYGSGWAPILVDWSFSGQTTLLDDPKEEAVTVPVAVDGTSGGGSIVSAEVILNVARQLPAGFGPGPSEGEVLMHELGHAVGLGHVSSASEAMYPTVRGIAAYGAGDLEGFAAVGLAAGCHAAPAAHPLDVYGSGQG